MSWHGLKMLAKWGAQTVSSEREGDFPPPQRTQWRQIPPQPCSAELRLRAICQIVPAGIPGKPREGILKAG